MRQLNIILGLVLFSLTGVNCGSDSTTGLGDDDDDVNTDIFNTGGGTGDTGAGGFDGKVDPVAVGFEFDGVLLNDGSLRGYTVNDVSQTGVMVLTFADTAYFDASDTATQDLHSCVAIGTWEPAEAGSSLDNINNANLWHSYEGTWLLDIGHNCTNLVDDWGFEGETLLNFFHGMRLGIGFGPWTDYLREQWSQESIDLHEDDFFAAYIAINDPNGTFDGDDWTSGLDFEWDDITEEPVADADDLLIAQPVVQIAPGGDLPQGYIRNFAYWYQDFPLMDFESLKDNAP